MAMMSFDGYIIYAIHLHYVLDGAQYIWQGFLMLLEEFYSKKIHHQTHQQMTLNILYTKINPFKTYF